MVLYNQKLFLEAFENKGKNSSYSGIKFWYILKFQNKFFPEKLNKNSNESILDFSLLKQN